MQGTGDQNPTYYSSIRPVMQISDRHWNYACDKQLVIPTIREVLEGQVSKLWDEKLGYVVDLLNRSVIDHPRPKHNRICNQRLSESFYFPRMYNRPASNHTVHPTIKVQPAHPAETTPAITRHPTSSTKLNGITSFVLTGNLNAVYANNGTDR